MVSNSLFADVLRVIREVEQEFFRQLRENRNKLAYYLQRRVTMNMRFGRGVQIIPRAVPGGLELDFLRYFRPGQTFHDTKVARDKLYPGL